MQKKKKDGIAEHTSRTNDPQSILNFTSCLMWVAGKFLCKLVLEGEEGIHMVCETGSELKAAFQYQGGCCDPLWLKKRARQTAFIALQQDGRFKEVPSGAACY